VTDTDISREGLADALEAISEQVPGTYVIPSKRTPEYQAAIHAEAAADGHQAGSLHDRTACGLPHH
jgi:hypothetical protein